jgi:hypothetical protein
MSFASCLCSQFRIALVVEDCDWRLFSPELDTIGGGCALNAFQDAEAEWLRAEPSADPNDDSSLARPYQMDFRLLDVRTDSADRCEGGAPPECGKRLRL